jgi:hypothetical protein
MLEVIDNLIALKERFKYNVSKSILQVSIKTKINEQKRIFQQVQNR